MEIRKVTELNINRWSGGTTTQFLIYPENADYSERNFLFRISSAVVEDEFSEFTSFNGFERILMILEGEIKLEHQTGKETLKKSLIKHDQTRFSGNWITKSEGKVTDFNVIFNPELNASLRILENQAVQLEKEDFVFIWSLTGSVGFSRYKLSSGSFGYGFTEGGSELLCEGRAIFVSIKGGLLQNG